MKNNNTKFVKNMENVENNENAKFIDKHIKYLEYRKEWIKENKDKVNNKYARARYLKKLIDFGDEYRTN